jgi:uncharacterized membrane protein
VLVPTAPVPVGGGLLYVPEHWVTPAPVSVEALTSLYVSMGVTSAQHLPRAAESMKTAQPLPAAQSTPTAPTAPQHAGSATSSAPDNRPA